MEWATCHSTVRQHGTAEEAFTRALRRLTSDRAHFSELDVLRFTAEEAQTTGVGADEVVAAVASGLARSQEIIRLKDVQGEARYTTHEMLKLERQLLQAASELHNRSSHAVPFAVNAEVERVFGSLRSEQRTALRHITAYADLACVNGVAGSGKTFLLSAARMVFEAAGLEVLGTSLAAQAARGLEEGSGIRSLHIHKLLYELEAGRLTIGNRSVLIVDESGMVGTRQMERLVRIVRDRGAKLVLVGDHRQLQAVSAGAPFRVLGERLGVVELNEIIRQREPWAREVVYQFRDGEAFEALQQLYARGLVTIPGARSVACHRAGSGIANGRRDRDGRGSSDAGGSPRGGPVAPAVDAK